MQLLRLAYREFAGVLIHDLTPYHILFQQDNEENIALALWFGVNSNLRLSFIFFVEKSYLSVMYKTVSDYP